MKLATAVQMRELDRLATEEDGIPSIDLMEQAADGIVQTALEVYKADNNGSLPTLTEGEGDTFDKLVSALKTAGYLKTDKIEEQSGGSFTYENGEVGFTPKSTEPSPGS